MTLVRAILVGSALAFSVLSGIGWRGGADLPRSSLAPSNAAFGIWAGIYIALAATTLALASHDWPHADIFTGLLCLALVACGAWLLLVRKYRTLSAVSIAVAFAASAAATALAPISKDTPMSWAVAVGPGLLAGWLSVAVVLGTLLALPTMPSAVSPAWLTPSLAGALAAGTVAGNPAAAAAVAWAALFSSGSAAYALAAAAGLGGVAAVVRLLLT
jgi:hypothetical protein